MAAAGASSPSCDAPTDEIVDIAVMEKHFDDLCAIRDKAVRKERKNKTAFVAAVRADAAHKDLDMPLQDGTNVHVRTHLRLMMAYFDAQEEVSNYLLHVLQPAKMRKMQLDREAEEAASAAAAAAAPSKKRARKG